MNWLSFLGPVPIIVLHLLLQHLILLLLLSHHPYHPKLIFFIISGTKWCGNGNMATDPGELGQSAATDACCRSHDLCPLVLHSGESKDGMKNQSPFTMSHCQCDQMFYKCLNSKFVIFDCSRAIEPHNNECQGPDNICRAYIICPY